MKKNIGIILRCWSTNNNIPIYGFRRDLLTFLRKYDVNIISIPIDFDDIDNDKIQNLEENVKNDIYTYEFNKIKELLDFCDGIIFPGGVQISEFDSLVAKYLYDNNKPTLGICLGMQILGKTFNDIGRERLNDYSHMKPDDKYAHKVTIEPDTFLYEILNKKEINVNSRHVLYIKDTRLSKNAYSEDGLLEGIEDKNKKFYLGVQWHPESLYDDENSKKIFDKFMSVL